jgi:hypothetical protein
VTPKENPFDLLSADRLYKNGQNFLEYTVEPAAPEMLLPARFSAVLGYPGDPADPYDSSGLLKTYEVEYKGKNYPRDFFKGKQEWAESIDSKGIDATLNLNENFSDMPILGPVSASSAFIGALTLSGAFADVMSKTKM